jgi:hypothetical protein
MGRKGKSNGKGKGVYWVRGVLSPVSSNLVLDGLEAIGQGSSWHRSIHNLNYVRWADDFLVTATSRQVLETDTLPRIAAFLAERGVRLSTEKTVITPLAQGFDCLGQTVRKPERPNGTPAKLQVSPSKASFQALRDKVRTLCKQARGTTPARLIETLNPVLRGWANYHRYVICGETFAKLDTFVWQRVYRWAKRRHSDKTGRWITDRYFPHHQGETWRFTDPTTGKQLIRVREAVRPQRYLKVKGAANPFDRDWEVYFQHRDRELALRASSPFRAKLLPHQHGLADRIATHSADMWTDPYPAADLHFYGMIFHDWPADKCRFLVRKSFESLLAGGRIIVHEMLFNEERTGPFGVAAFNMVMLMYVEGEQFSGREIAGFLDEAGFHDIQVTPTFGYWSIVTGRKP